MLKIIKYKDDYIKLEQALKSDPEYLLSRDSVELVYALTGANAEIPEGKEKINLGNAFVEMRRISKEEGLTVDKVTEILQTKSAV